jgi:hypothetical protein
MDCDFGERSDNVVRDRAFLTGEGKLFRGARFFFGVELSAAPIGESTYLISNVSPLGSDGLLIAVLFSAISLPSESSEYGRDVIERFLVDAWDCLADLEVLLVGTIVRLCPR